MYNRLDTLAAWYVGNLVSLDDQQRSNLRAWLAQTLEWHRESELGRYAQFLRELVRGSRTARPSRAGYSERSTGSKDSPRTSPRRPRRKRHSCCWQLTPEQVEEF